MDDFSERKVKVTLKGKEWFAIMAWLSGKSLSEIGTNILKNATNKIAEQIDRASTK